MLQDSWSTVKLKVVLKQEVSYLPSRFSLYLKEKLKFSNKKNHIVIDLGIYFPLCENESYNTSEAKAGFFYTQRSM